MLTTFLDLLRDDTNKEECCVQGLMVLGIIGFVLVAFLLRFMFG